MSDAGSKKRKAAFAFVFDRLVKGSAESSARSMHAALQKTFTEDGDGRFLRQFIGPEVYDGDYCTGGKMNWTRFWWPRKLPQTPRDVAAFVVMVAELHEDDAEGSYELQLLLTAINAHTWQHYFASDVKALLPTSKLSEKMQTLIKEALDHFTTYVVFDRNYDAARPRLRYHSFKDKR